MKSVYYVISLLTFVAPEIYGHDDVKKALLLQLVGGVTRYDAILVLINLSLFAHYILGICL